MSPPSDANMIIFEIQSIVDKHFEIQELLSDGVSEHNRLLCELGVTPDGSKKVDLAEKIVLLDAELARCRVAYFGNMKDSMDKIRCIVK